MTNKIGHNQHKEQEIEKLAYDLNTKVCEHLLEKNDYVDKDEQPSKFGRLLIDISSALLELELFKKRDVN